MDPVVLAALIALIGTVVMAVATLRSNRTTRDENSTQHAATVAAVTAHGLLLEDVREDVKEVRADVHRVADRVEKLEQA